MKGMVFTELLEMVEDRFGLATVNRIITAANLPNGGAYTAIGTYDHAELLRLVGELSEVTGITAAELQRLFGRRLFERFSQNYAMFFTGVSDAYTFLERVDTYVHVEVRKLYPEAELPRFSHRRYGDELVLDYESRRPFADLALGLIEGCIAHYGVPTDVTRADLETGARTRTRFTLLRRPAA